MPQGHRLLSQQWSLQGQKGLTALGPWPGSWWPESPVFSPRASPASWLLSSVIPQVVSWCPFPSAGDIFLCSWSTLFPQELGHLLCSGGSVSLRIWRTQSLCLACPFPVSTSLTFLAPLMTLRFRCPRLCTLVTAPSAVHSAAAWERGTCGPAVGSPGLSALCTGCPRVAQGPAWLSGTEAMVSFII